MKTLDEMIAVMQAAKEGKTIECRISNAHALSHWYEEKNPWWNWKEFDYRVKPGEPRRVWISYDFEDAIEGYLAYPTKQFGDSTEFIELTPEVRKTLLL